MDEALPPAELPLVQRVQHELATTGTVTDATFSQLHRTMEQLADEELRVLVETFVRTSATLPPTDAGDMAGPGTPAGRSG
jgi:hypothetical protein